MSPILPPADRYLARHVLRDGHDYGLATVTSVSGGKVVIEPFTRETPSTVFIDGTLIITTDSDGRDIISRQP